GRPGPAAARAPTTGTHRPGGGGRRRGAGRRAVRRSPSSSTLPVVRGRSGEPKIASFGGERSAGRHRQHPPSASSPPATVRESFRVPPLHVVSSPPAPVRESLRVPLSTLCPPPPRPSGRSSGCASPLCCVPPLSPPPALA